MYSTLPQSTLCLPGPTIIGQIRERTTSFSANCLSEWNKLYVRQSQILGCFKKKILSLIRPSLHPVYRIHDPKGLAILTQFDIGLRKLNLHKFKHNFKETVYPMYPVNYGVQYTEHFLLLCPRYVEQKSIFLIQLALCYNL